MLVIRNLEMLDFDFLESVVVCEVEDYQVIPVESFNSVSARIELVYSGEKANDAPESVFIKLKKEGEGEIEYRFYEQEKGDYFPHCYHNAYDRETGYSHLVLEDLSQDYHAPVSREDLIGLNGVPPKEMMGRIIDALAALHRNHWEQKDKWEIPHYFQSDEAFAKRLQSIGMIWRLFRQRAMKFQTSGMAILRKALRNCQRFGKRISRRDSPQLGN
jgi:hypothetical protein